MNDVQLVRQHSPVPTHPLQLLLPGILPARSAVALRAVVLPDSAASAEDTATPPLTGVGVRRAMHRLRDVAVRAGVPAGTVSRVLTSTESAVRISAATRERVLAVTREVNYTPDALASGLRSQHRRIVGVIVRELTMAFPVTVVSLLDTALAERGYHFLLAQARTAADVRRFSRMFERSRVRGVLRRIGGAMLDDTFLADYSRRLGGHVVGIAGEGEGRRFPVNIHVDNRGGIQLALDHLATLGHERIAFIGAMGCWDIAQRFSAFLSHFEAHASRPGGTYVIEETATVDPQEGGDAMLRLLALPYPPTAAIFVTDEMALVGAMAAQQAGYSVPGDISVVGFNDIPWAGYSRPPLTTVRQPVKPMVEPAVECLLNLVEDESGEHIASAHVVPPELVVRSSTAPPNRRLTSLRRERSGADGSG